MDSAGAVLCVKNVGWCLGAIYISRVTETNNDDANGKWLKTYDKYTVVAVFH